MVNPSTVRVQQKSVRKPKLAPPKIANSDHLRYLNEKAKEDERKGAIVVESVFTRPTSVPGSILVTDDSQSDANKGDGRRSETASRGTSRPGTHNTIRDGIIIRWESEDKPLLRRPRTSTFFVTPRRGSAKLARSRFGVAMTKTKAKGIVNSITQATLEAKHGKTAAQMCLEQSLDKDNPYQQHKSKLIRQYRLWNGRDMQHMNLPPIHIGSTAALTSRSYNRYTNYSRDGSANQALNQLHLSNESMHSVMSKSNHVFSKSSGYSPRRCTGMSRVTAERQPVPVLDQVRLAIGDLL